MRGDGKARETHGGNTHMVVTVISIFPFSRVLITKGNSSIGLSDSVMFTLLTVAFLYQVPETCNKQSPVQSIHSIPSQVLPQAPAHGQGPEKHSRAQAEAPDMVWSHCPVPVFLCSPENSCSS